MSTEKPDSESQKREPLQSHRFIFDDKRNMIGEKHEAFGSRELGGEVSGWIENLLTSYGYNDKTDDDDEFNIPYCIAELTRNALESGERVTGSVDLSIGNGVVTVIIIDDGYGFEEPEASIETNPGHGLSHALEYADQLIIESLGKCYKKKGRELKLAGESPITGGTKVTFIKRLEKLEVEK